MSDGTVLRADVYFPVEPGTNTPATGPFPVLLQQTPYGKAFIADASAIANTDIDYLVDRGYIVVIADVRGTGDSGGSFDLFDPVQSTDGVTLAKWAAALPGLRRPGRPVRRVLHGDQPVPDGRGGRAGLAHQGHVPHHRRQRPLRRHGDPGRHPRHRVLRHLHRPAVGAGPDQPRPAAAGGRHGEREHHHPRAGPGQPGADRGRPRAAARLVHEAGARRRDRLRGGRLRRRLLGGAQPGPRPLRRGGRPHPGLPGRRVERPVRVGRAPQLRRPAEPLRRALPVRRHDADPEGDTRATSC